MSDGEIGSASSRARPEAFAPNGKSTLNSTRSTPNTEIAHSTGGTENIPLVVTHTCRRKYADGASPSPVRAAGIVWSMRSSMNGIISPQCPMISRSPECRSNTPETTIRSACSPASACHPQALVASAPAAGPGSPPYSTDRRAAGGGAGCR